MKHPVQAIKNNVVWITVTFI